MKFSYKLDGAVQFQKLMRALPERMATRVVDGAVNKAAGQMLDRLYDGAPVGPGEHKAGHLRDNLKKNRLEKSRINSVWAVHIGKGFWGAFRERGTSRQAAQPWFRPIFDAFSQATYFGMCKDLIEGLRREAKKLASDYKTASRAIGVRRK